MEKLEQLEKFLNEFSLEIEMEKMSAEPGTQKRVIAISVLKTIGLVKDKIKEINEA